MHLSELPLGTLRVFAAFFGLIWGSFLNVVIYRVPQGMSVVRPGSHCPACGKPIRGYDNIPVLSFLILRGKARCCGAKMSWRYPVVELLGGAASLGVLEAVVLHLPPETSLLRASCVYLSDFAIVMALIAAAFIDFEHMFLPDSITLPGTVLGIFTASLRGMSIVGALVGAAFGFLVVAIPFVWLYRAFRGRQGMGLGDAKLLMLAGAWIGLSGVLFTLFGGAVQGSVGALAIYLIRGKLEEPESVKKDLEELRKAAAEGDEEAKEALEDDPLAQPQGEGVGQARLAFGPFLILAFVEFLLFAPVIREVAAEYFIFF